MTVPSELQYILIDNIIQTVLRSKYGKREGITGYEKVFSLLLTVYFSWIVVDVHPIIIMKTPQNRSLTIMSHTHYHRRAEEAIPCSSQSRTNLPPQMKRERGEGESGWFAGGGHVTLLEQRVVACWGP